MKKVFEHREEHSAGRKWSWMAIGVLIAGLGGCGEVQGEEVEHELSKRRQAGTHGELDVLQPTEMLWAVDGVQNSRKTYDRYWALHTMSRAAVHLYDGVSALNGQEVQLSGVGGSGFLIGPNVLVTAYHVIEPKILERYLYHPHVAWNKPLSVPGLKLQTDGLVRFATEADGRQYMDGALRRRLAQLGLHNEAFLPDLEHLKLSRNSKVLKAYVYHHCNKKSHDVALIKLRPFALMADPIGTKKPATIPPGTLYDWVPTPSRDDQGRIDPVDIPSSTPDEDEMFAILQNNHYFQKVDIDAGYANRYRVEYQHTLVSLPGPRSINEDTDECSYHPRCEGWTDATVERYVGCLSADVDAIRGTSGGAAVYFNKANEPHAVGVMQSANPGVDHWAQEPILPVDPTDKLSSRFTALQSSMLNDADTGWRTPEAEPEPKVTESPQHCHGDCSEDLELLRCRDAFSDRKDRPMVGLLGSPNKAGDKLGSIAAVCGLNSVHPYTDAWPFLRTLGVNRPHAMSWNFPGPKGDSLVETLRHAHLRRPLDNGRTEAEFLPMQLCRPDQFLVGLLFDRSAGGVDGIDALLCRSRAEIKGHDPSLPDVVTLTASEVVHGERVIIRQHMGDPDATTTSTSIRCGDGEVMTGLYVNKRDSSHSTPDTTRTIALQCGTL